MRVILIAAALLILSVAHAEGDASRQPDAVITVEPQSIPATNAIVSRAVDVEYELAQEVFVGPEIIKAEIRDGHQMTTLYISLASRVNTRVKILLSNPEVVVTNQDLDKVTLFAGSQHAINFVAFSPHSGTITILNENDEVLAVVPYTVDYAKEFRHSVSGSVNLSGTFSLSYSLSSRKGWSTSMGVGINSEGNFSGSVSGSYSW